MPDRPEHHPITGTPRRVRPPYDRRDAGLDRDLFAPEWQRESREDNRARNHTDKLDALIEQCPADLTDTERGLLDWLAGWEIEPVAVVASLLYRARQEGHAAGQVAARRDDAALLRDKAETSKDTEKPRTVLRRVAVMLERRARPRH